MFGRRKGTKGPVANQLRRQSEPNKLSWASQDTANEAGDAEEFEPETLDDSDDFDDTEVDASFEDDEEPDSEDEVEIARRQEELQAELARQAEEFGLTNYDPRSTYGENGEDVLAVLEELERMDEATAEQLADAWMAGDPSERDIVEREMRHRHRTGGHSYELSAAEDAVATWLNKRLATDEEDKDLWRIVAEAARGAVDALILDKELDDADFDALYGAWEEVMEAEDGEAEGEDDSSGESRAEAAGGAEDSAEAGDELEFGPNTELVRQFIARMEDLTLDQLLNLAAYWKEQERGDLRQAHDAVRDLANEDQKWRDQIQAAQKEVAAWLDRLPIATDHISRRDTKVLDARKAALPAVVDAITGLALADLLEPEDAETLYLPWKDAVGDPALPEFEEDGQGS
jgi:hypothetical protein